MAVRPEPSRARRVLTPLLTIVALLALWQAVVVVGIVPNFLLPTPVQVVQALVEDAALLASHCVTTLAEAAAGLAAGVALGFVFAVLMDRSFGMRMTKMWMIVFALAFAMTLSALDMFFVFSDMYVAGYPVFNEDFYDTDRYTNGILMAVPVITTFVTAVTAVYITLAYRGQSKDIFIDTEEVEA